MAAFIEQIQSFTIPKRLSGYGWGRHRPGSSFDIRKPGGERSGHVTGA
jgi:hypothetical protein